MTTQACNHKTCLSCGGKAKWRIKGQAHILSCENPKCMHLISGRSKTGRWSAAANGFAEQLATSAEWFLQGVRNVIRSVFEASYFEPAPNFLSIRSSGPTGLGVFAVDAINFAMILGIYKGTVIFTQQDLIQRDPGDSGMYIHQFQILPDLTVWVDGNVRASDRNNKINQTFVTWPAHINHQWEFPTEDGRVPDFLQGVQTAFANCRIKDKGEDVGQVQPLRTIHKNEELTVDYDTGYWTLARLPRKPIWDFTKIDNRQVDFFRHWLYSSSPHGTDEEKWKIDLREKMNISEVHWYPVIVIDHKNEEH